MSTRNLHIIGWSLLIIALAIFSVHKYEERKNKPSEQRFLTYSGYRNVSVTLSFISVLIFGYLMVKSFKK